MLSCWAAAPPPPPTLRRAVEHNVRAMIVGSIPEAELRAFLGYTDGLRGLATGPHRLGLPAPRDERRACPRPSR